ncbi:hypothetical protein GQX73_g1802 [Xylaria multiplex]|uniref:Uncharacterized protein n=1 Tax=Xylaria multiplex TaxID=323545 RepID=A0A7C8MRB4_9PEZI|nr:hypothetical protein GQX73_g1802 [Xylaria multiplex]
MTARCGNCTGGTVPYNPTDQSQQQQQSNETIQCGGRHNSLNWWEDEYVCPSPRLPGQGEIIKIGDGTIVAGQSTESFADEVRISLCYQCYTLLKTREESCSAHSCRRTKEVGMPFKDMPPNAAEACEDFQALLVWWMDKVDHGADESIERRAKERVQEMRDDIPDYNSASMADLLKILQDQSKDTKS